ncbi:orotidine-5'-phosphate decarboxylase [Bacillus sp. ISL-35]|uniref:orotidine-5'-phosphate decarboxylase n=1 Tax=Bacillus sp. ISL-35 TaxID=2819122 RepID=UPI001BE6B1F3|nr:orotidine-5'-phosphate decarboxylase [Bacillus sp. ISL-35]MBT2678510.1 orotidine-5'-phosphate decarboxylase [Bacillus sp. ISL-35]MBT2701759.1 orotidine-5'-phosphate decarboxylase [Chryseobacterium sp. ISL-80]
MKDSLIIALDFPNKGQVLDFLEPFGTEQLFVKVGMELFYSEGPSIIEELKKQNHKIFLDLKLHDIPNTVKSAMKVLAGLGCDLVNVHAAGGSEMMTAALEGLDAGTSSGLKRPDCIAVTQLTSTSEAQVNTEQLIGVSLQESVLNYAELAKKSGLDGVVCSPHEAGMIHHRLGREFHTVTPGIRTVESGKQDQKRIATPVFAREQGISAIVVGRPITRSANPLESYIKIKNDWKGVRI